VCDICSLQCSEENCEREFCVHIADFCVARDAVEVRCRKHPPTEDDGWVLFTHIRDFSKRYEPTFYMRLLVPALLINTSAVRQYVGCYYVGLRGGIHPNATEWKEALYEPQA